MKHILLLLLLATLLVVSCKQSQDTLIELQNPFIPGSFADPSIVEHEGTFYIYATSDPWAVIRLPVGCRKISNTGSSTG
jgi:hypothetical protein